ncbi:MAG TPA: hemolysin III family protein [Dehalococcoidia bacterium]|nr:hemolysin III family protein [Dehalococcoidia bacterium]
MTTQTAAMAGTHARDDVRPKLRGVLHLAAALLAPAGLAFLVLQAHAPGGYVGAAIYGATLIICYGTSATYHLLPWGRTPRAVMRRIDHAMIFALIAGTYTPFCLVVLGTAWGVTMLSLVWALGGAGMLMKTLWSSAPRWLGVAAYLVVGWLALIPSGELVSWFSAPTLALLIAGGVLYSLGALVYAARRPDPYPRWFGFHEVFHALVIAGGAIHFALVAFYVLPS